MAASGLTPLTGPSKPQYSPSVNPLARAMAETESANSGGQSTRDSGTDIFRDALSKTGGNFDNLGGGDDAADSQDAQAGGLPSQDTIFDQSQREQQQQAEMLAQRKKEQLRANLHRQVNNLETDVYGARQEAVKKEIEQLRNELQLLVKDVSKFHKEVELTLMTETAQPGQDGKYHFTFFHQLRTWIMMLRHKFQSMSSWATQMSSKKKKRKGVGLNIDGQSHEKTSTIQDMMHHERSTAYSGS